MSKTQIKNQDDLDEILSVGELQYRKDAAYEALQLAIAKNEAACKAYNSENGAILAAIKELCNESIVIDNELKKFRKAASEGIIFDNETIYRAMIYGRLYRQKDMPIIEHFELEDSKSDKINELRNREGSRRVELKELGVDVSITNKVVIKARRDYRAICADLEAAESIAEAAIVKESSVVDCGPCIELAELNDHLDCDRDREPINFKGLWSRVVQFFKKVFSNN